MKCNFRIGDKCRLKRPSLENPGPYELQIFEECQKIEFKVVDIRIGNTVEWITLASSSGENLLTTSDFIERLPKNSRLLEPLPNLF